MLLVQVEIHPFFFLSISSNSFNLASSASSKALLKYPLSSSSMIHSSNARQHQHKHANSGIVATSTNVKLCSNHEECSFCKNISSNKLRTVRAACRIDQHILETSQSIVSFDLAMMVEERRGACFPPKQTTTTAHSRTTVTGTHIIIICKLLALLFAPCDSSSSLPTSLSASALRRYRRACHRLQPRHRPPRSLFQAKMEPAAHTSKECSVSQRRKNSP